MRLEEPLPPDLAPEAAASITCFVEEADDVWTLYSLIEKGDEVSCNTTRKVKGDNPRAASEKRHMTLTVAAKVTKGKVEPNCEYSLDGNGGLTLTRRVPFQDVA